MCSTPFSDYRVVLGAPIAAGNGARIVSYHQQEANCWVVLMYGIVKGIEIWIFRKD
jgi:hypothetical protein